MPVFSLSDVWQPKLDEELPGVDVVTEYQFY